MREERRKNKFMLEANKIKKIDEYLQVMINNKLRFYQKDWLYSMLNNKYTGILSARQLGKSLTIAIATLYYSIGYRTDDGKEVHGHDVFIASKDHKTAKNIISMINNQLDVIEKLYKIRIRDKKLGGVVEIYLLNGSKIKSMPGTSDSMQGFTGSVIIDELSANDHDIDELMSNALILSVSNESYRVVTCTNADIEGSYVHNFWYSESDYWENVRKNWKLFDLNIYEAFPEGLTDNIIRVKNSMAKNMWLRFYENTFLGEGTGLLEPDYLRQRISPYIANREDILWTDGINYLAIDPGFSENGNPAGVVVININNNKTTVIYEDLWFSLSMEETISRIAALKTKYMVRGIRVDQGTIGYQLNIELQKRFGTTMVKPMSCSAQNQFAWFNSIINLLESERLYFMYDKFVIQDLSSISINGEKLIVPNRPLSIYQPKEKVIFPKSGDYKIHADAGIALCMLVPDILNSLNKPSYGFKKIETNYNRRNSIINKR